MPIGAVSAALGMARPPAVAVPPPPQVPQEPTALQRYIEEREAAVPDLRPHLAKTIRWAHPERPARAPVAIVYLHGFAGSHRELVPVCERLAGEWEANVFHTRLAGHGRDGAALAEVGTADWLADAREALAVGKRLGERVVVVGTSTGGTLATWLAAAVDPPEVAAYVLVSPNFGPRHLLAELLLLPGAERWSPWIHGATHRFTPATEEHARLVTPAFPTPALVPMMRLVGLVRALDLGRVCRPTQVLYCPGDRVVAPSAIRAAYRRLGAARKELVPVEEPEDPARHTLAGDLLSPATTPEVLAAIRGFVEPVLAGEALA
ncbi:alpha/beta hydrolase [Thiohalorhabdus denitrificans]|uniref:Esterase/lipase n=1 Tax=Thiohalorhabdus denitrificans TaxID=381306 RepID=A0A1G5ETG0_9GAMM|nr:alpha/beta fold hydrolase [Thiohalorhabdus denitrificans]SCY30286.1 Esterase/lipase [Thiohalorhabdus denitrificans]